jgi:hypothetical protein
VRLTNKDVIEAHYEVGEITAEQLDHPAWSKSTPVQIARYWSGQPAPPERHAEARLIWTSTSLLAQFKCRQAEPLVVTQTPHTEQKTIGLWDRDVCEIFMAPVPRIPSRYFEFEAAPTGEWIDLAIEMTDSGRKTDWTFQSGMTTASRIDPDRVTTVIKVPWTGSMPKPNVGDEWRVNLCRCVGRDPTRGYLAWQPTGAPVPNFHVPEVFGRLRFV